MRALLLSDPIKKEVKVGKIDKFSTVQMIIGDKFNGKAHCTIEYDKDDEAEVEYLIEFKKGVEMVFIGGEVYDESGKHS